MSDLVSRLRDLIVKCSVEQKESAEGVGLFALVLECQEALDEASAALEQQQWVRVGILGPTGVEFFPFDNYPDTGRWVLIQSESATGITYEARQHDPRTWPSFGVRWQYIPPPPED